MPVISRSNDIPPTVSPRFAGPSDPGEGKLPGDQNGAQRRLAAAESGGDREKPWEMDG